MNTNRYPLLLAAGAVLAVVAGALLGASAVAYQEIQRDRFEHG